MFGGLLIVLSLATDAPRPGHNADHLKSYAEARAALGRGDASAQVRLALWCEAHGLQAEKLRHLALAVVKDPGNATARGLLGLVAYRGRWQSLDAVAGSINKDEAAAKALADYNARRSSLKNTADAHWKLAIWCESRGLQAEALAHFTVVTRLDPRRDAAWKRLGCRRVNGRWMTEDQIESERNELESAKKATQRWKPILTQLRLGLESSEASRREAAGAALLEISDPDAVPVVVALFGEGTPARQSAAVRILGQIDGGGSSRALAMLAVFGRSGEVRRRAKQVLWRRDPRDYLGLVVGFLRDPIKFEVQPLVGLYQPGMLTVEGKTANYRTTFALPEGSGSVARSLPPRLFSPDIPFNPFGGQNLWQAMGYPGGLTGPALTTQDLASIAVDPGHAGGVIARVQHANAHAPITGADALLAYGTMVAAQQDLHIARRMAIQQELGEEATAYGEMHMSREVGRLEAYNERTTRANSDAVDLLTSATGQKLGDEPEAWRKWWVEEQGYAYRSATSPAFKPTVDSFFEVSTPRMPTDSLFHACFASGTIVPGLPGPRRIEELRIGDQVLTQDTATGALSYEPILTVFHNNPAATLRLKFDDEEVVATPIHRFWRAGKGWAMARDLRPGDLVRKIDGTARVEAVMEEVVQPVFNLEVARHRSFFVGNTGMLVHDNSLVETVALPFDAVPPLIIESNGR